jgi:single-stranded-DNA-specific exonuclease
MQIKNLKKAAQRIEKAIKDKENIILYSDADLDGTTSLIILEETIKNLGGKISLLYFPDRGIEGYGLNEAALKLLKKYAPGLLILLDCGISNFKEIEEAKKMGLETIIIDHHEILEKLPPASIIVDPKQKGDRYPFKFLAACGLIFKLAELLLGKKISKNLKQSFLELVALGTLADMMPQEKDNQIFIEQGLRSLPYTFRPGLRSFFKFFNPQELSLRELASKIISVLQITDSKNHLTESYLVLSTPNEKRAQKLVEVLLEKSAQRREVIRQLSLEIEEKLTGDSLPIIFEGGEDFPLSLTGAIASRICNKFKKPTFIYSSNGKISRCSVRVPKGINSVEVLEYCAKFLEVYGGHPQASGFTCKLENLEKLKQCLVSYFAYNP